MTGSPATQPSLLLRIRDPQDARAWSQFTDLYAPLINGFARRYGLQDADAADLTQEVLRLVARSVKDFSYDPNRGSFRGWLYTVVRNQVRKFVGRKRDFQAGVGGTEALQRLDQQLSPEVDQSAEWNADYELRIFTHAAAQVRGDFKEPTWQAFWMTAVDGKSGKEAAEKLGMTVAAVYLAKSRVMTRLKEQIQLLQAE